MGTRADFYLGRGKKATWLGSIAWDGYPDGISEKVLIAKTKDAFLSELGRFFKNEDGVTLPAEGWPWPWKDSGSTDYAYAYERGRVHISCFGSEWVTAERWQLYEAQRAQYLEAMKRFEKTGEGDEPEEPDDIWIGDQVVEFPDMADKQSVQHGHKSGLILIASR